MSENIPQKFKEKIQAYLQVEDINEIELIPHQYSSNLEIRS